MNNNYFMKVFFNNSCKICKTEIDIYKKQNIEGIEWIDITNNKVAETETNKSAKILLRRLHVKEQDKIYGGAKAFLLVWKTMPKFRFLYYIFKTPIIFQIFSLFYEIAAFILYIKNRKQLKS